MSFRKNLVIYARSVRAMRTIHWITMVFLGFVIRPCGMSGIPDFIIPAVAVAFMWQYTTMINDIYDIEIDRKSHPDRALVRGEISVSTYGKMAYASLALGILISFFGGIYVFLMNLLFFTLAVAYSRPPIRIRNRWYGTAVMGSASAMEVIAGYYSHFWLTDGAFFNTYPATRLFLDIVIIVFFALSIAPNITAYKDYEGDVEAGASTIYTVLGRKKGKDIVSAMLAFLFILPAFLFPEWFNIALSLLSGLLAFILFHRYECAKCVFSLYLVEMLYFLMYFLFIA